VTALGVSSADCTAVDLPGIVGEEGLTTGVYSDLSSFTIEQRDAYTNRVFVGPVKEQQVVTLTGATNLAGTWAVHYDGASVTLPAGESLSNVEAALEQLGVGAVTVWTTSATAEVATATVTATDTSPYLTPKIDGTPASLGALFKVGDWIRLGDVYVLFHHWLTPARNYSYS